MESYNDYFNFMQEITKKVESDTHPDKLVLYYKCKYIYIYK